MPLSVENDNIGIVNDLNTQNCESTREKTKTVLNIGGIYSEMGFLS